MNVYRWDGEDVEGLRDWLEGSDYYMLMQRGCTMYLQHKVSDRQVCIGRNQYVEMEGKEVTNSTIGVE